MVNGKNMSHIGRKGSGGATKTALDRIENSRSWQKRCI